VEDFEEFLKKEAQGFKMEPTPRVWKGIQAGMPASRRFPIWWYGAASIFILITASVIYYSSIFQRQSNLKSNEGTVNPSIKNAEKPLPEIKADQVIINPQVVTPSINKKGTVTQRPPVSSTKISQEKIKNQNHNLEISNQDNKLNTDTKDGNLVSRIEMITPKKLSFKQSEILMPIAIEIQQIEIKNIPEKPIARKFYFTVTAGINLAKPLKINYNRFVKPALGYSFLFTAGYAFTPLLGISTGLGYQHSSYKVGAVRISPETIYLNTPNGNVSKTANYKLSNESMNLNIRRQLLIPVSLDLKLKTGEKGYAKFSLGIDIAKELYPRYLIKNTESDRLFRDNQLLNSVNNYLTFGYSLLYYKNHNIGFLMGYKFQYQLNNTFKSDYNLREHTMINGVHFGIQF
jgi:hypothetical protein